MENKYIFDQKSKVWCREGLRQISYSDGDEAENYLFSVISKANDITTSSKELISAIRDWPSEYHLSMFRQNLLRPFYINNSAKILELGSGCGAISRYLGELGANVVSVEGSLRRASIVAERCRDLSNVKIVCDNIIEFKSTVKFDYVILIGVIEYAPIFINSSNPVKTLLEHAKSFLKDDGILILSIENQLGLKYFNGCTEDHTGIPYFGINDCYRTNSVITFARAELSNLLSISGYNKSRFYYPFPDYKLPKIILSPEAFFNPHFNIADLLCTMDSRDYTGNTYRSFSENRVWQLLNRNGLIQEFSNSFLIFASKNELDEKKFTKSKWLAALYSTERKINYITETLFIQSHNPYQKKILVNKKLLFPNFSSIKNKNTSFRFIHLLQRKSEYLHGSLLLSEFQHQISKHCDAVEILKPWIELLQKKSSDPQNPMSLIHGKYIDFIPKNIIHGNNGVLFFVDIEWIIEQKIPLAWVVVRGIINSLSSSMWWEYKNEISIQDFIELCFMSCKIDTNRIDWSLIFNLENSFQKSVFNQFKEANYKNIISKKIGINSNLTNRIRELEKEIKIAQRTLPMINLIPLFFSSISLKLLKYMLKLFPYKKHY